MQEDVGPLNMHTFSFIAHVFVCRSIGWLLNFLTFVWTMHHASWARFNAPKKIINDHATLCETILTQLMISANHWPFARVHICCLFGRAGGGRVCACVWESFYMDFVTVARASPAVIWDFRTLQRWWCSSFTGTKWFLFACSRINALFLYASI